MANVTINGVSYDLSNQSDRANARNANPGLIVDATSVYNPSTGQQTNATGGGVPSTGTVGAPAAPQLPNAGADQYARAINQGVAALNSSDLKAFNEMVREWEATFGFNRDQFNENVREFNQNFGITQAGLTGTYEGAPTQQAQNQAANFLGTYQGQQTLQAQNQAFTQALAAAGLTGTYNGQQTLAAQNQAYNQQLGLINQAATLQANPFRQAQAIGQMNQLLSGRGVAGFQSPTTTANGSVPANAAGGTFSGMNNLQAMIDDIRGGPQATNSIDPNAMLAQIPTPNKVNSTEFLRMTPQGQNLILSGIQSKYGIEPTDALAQIKATLPAFNAPSTFGQVGR